MRNESRLALPLLAAFALSCSGDGGGPPSVATVAVSPNPATVEVGAAVQFTAVARDVDGDVIGGRTFTWTSTATGTATVSTSGGLAMGVAAGVATIRAETGGVTGSAQLTVTAPGPASVTIDTDSTDVAVGQNVQLGATVRDGDGMIISAEVSWSSSNVSVASVDDSGLVTGEAEGSAEITASAGGVDSDPTIIVVIPPGNVTVTSITPSPMVEGQSATLRGEGFSATAAQNNVTINGFSAPVTSASDTLLVIDVPEECFPAGDVTIAISTPTGSSGAVTHPMQPAKAPLSMAAGEFMLIQDPADFCLQFGEQLLNEEYVFGVQSTSESVSSLTAVRVRGQIPAGAGGAVSTALTRPATTPFAFPTTSPADARSLEARAAHARVLERSMDAVAGLRALRASPLDPSSLGASRVPGGLSVGDTIPVRVANVAGNICTDFVTREAVVRAVGATAVWLEQTDNPAGGLSLAQYNSLAADFDAVIFPTDTAYFGAPTDIDSNDVLAIVVSREVNVAGFNGFVSPADFFPTGTCPASNEGEVTYVVAPDPAGQFGRVLSADRIESELPDIVAHEFVHNIQLGRRITQNRPNQALWILESQATLGEEVVGWEFNSRTRGQNYDADVIFGEHLPSQTPWHLFGFGNLAAYYGFEDAGLPKVANAPEQCSFLATSNNGPCAFPVNLVYVPYIFLRWLSDHFAANEQQEHALHRSLIDSDEAGYSNITASAGEPFEQLLAQWAATLYTDDRSAGLAPRVTLPSWDLFSFDQGIIDQARLLPRSVGFASFSSDIQVRGGSSSYYLVSGLNRPHTAVRARSQAGSLLPGVMQLWIVRLQ